MVGKKITLKLKPVSDSSVIFLLFFYLFAFFFQKHIAFAQLPMTFTSIPRLSRPEN